MTAPANFAPWQRALDLRAPSRHDYAVNALFELKPNSHMAYHAASTFCGAGAGVRALSTWISSTGDGDLPLVQALGTFLEPALIPTGIKLLTICNPPNNHALYMFISRNSAQLEDAQRRSVVRLVTWPVRTDTSRLGDVLGWVASKHFPDALEFSKCGLVGLILARLTVDPVLRGT